MAQILDGKIVRDKIAKNLESRIQNLESRPRLIIIQVGDNPESNTYIAQKIKFAELIGANVKLVKLPEDVTEKTLNFQLSTFNSDNSIHGIIVQIPIPKNLDKDSIIEAIDPKKDVDGQTAVNIKKLIEGNTKPVILGSKATPESDSGQALRFHSGQLKGSELNRTVLRLDSGPIVDHERSRMARMTNQGFVPATTKGILTMLDYYKIAVSEKHVVIVGRSSLVGKPTALAMLNLDATVTVCHSKTQNLPSITKTADILIVAVGKPKLITKDHVSPNQTVIDVGINVTNQPTNNKPETEPAGRKLVGDVDFNEVSEIVSAISPVPGGVGPLTVASLFENLLKAYNQQA